MGVHDAPTNSPDLAQQLKGWLTNKPKGRPVFGDMPKMTARMMRGDLKRAGVPYADEKGRVADFHALRHTYISRLVRSGASVKTAQVMARHSTPTLTIGRYAHADLRDQVAALEALPKTTAKQAS